MARLAAKQKNFPSPVPETGLEDYPFEYLLQVFCEKIKHLKADTDEVHGLLREYVSTSHLYIPYCHVFGSDALATNSLIYRLKHIKPEEFTDDFLVMHDTGRAWEAKYFVNRLNHALLRRIYVPVMQQDMRQLINQTLLFENDYITLHELDEVED